MTDKWTPDRFRVVGGSDKRGPERDAADADELPIPPRGWLLGNTFCRGFLSSLLGDGGVGKTALRILQILSLVTGRPLSGEHVFQRSRALIVSLEDNADELRRRIRAALIHHGISRDEIRGWLYTVTFDDLIDEDPPKLAALTDWHITPGSLGPMLREMIARLQIDLVMLDPFVKAHSVPENDNTAIDQVAAILAKIATKHDCAVDAPHHMAKGPSDAGNAKRGRGASAFKDAGRLVYTLSAMTPEEASVFDIDDDARRYLVRVDSAKINIAPPAIEAKWFKLIGVEIGNATDVYPHGDEVQTVEPWTPPDLFAHVSIILANTILDKIDIGLDDGERYSAYKSAVARAAWRVVSDHVPSKNEKQCRLIISTWLRTGVLETRAYESPVQRKVFQGLFVNNLKRPS